MPYPDKINNLVNVTGDQTLAAGGHAARHNDVNDALEELADVLTVPAADTLAFAPDGLTERVRITSAGNVGIGTTSPTNPLTVSTGGSFPAAQSQGFTGVFQNVTHAGISILSGNASNGWVYFGDTDATGVGGVNYSHALNQFAFRINNATRVTFDSTGAIIPNGGVYLGGTAAANQLDDYEEGTWTPTYEPETGAFGSITYDSRTTGYYTKIGRTVFFQCHLETDTITTGTASGVLLVGNLPFTITNLGGLADQAPVSTFSEGWTTQFPTTAQLKQGSTQIYLNNQLTTGGLQAIDVSNMGGANANRVWMSGQYITAA